MERPYVHINFAVTLDGKLSNPDGSRLRISDEWDMARVHRLRAKLGAVLVGANTVIMDDPKLTVKPEHSNPPPPLTKIVLDGSGRIPANARFLTTPGRSVILTSVDADPAWIGSMERARTEQCLDIEIVKLPGDGRVFDLGDALKALKDRGIEKVMVEGGAMTIKGSMAANLFDALTVYMGTMLIGGSGPSVDIKSFTGGPMKLELAELIEGPNGVLLIYGRRG